MLSHRAPSWSQASGPGPWSGFSIEVAGRGEPSQFQAAQSGLDPPGAWASVPQGLENWAAAFTP